MKYYIPIIVFAMLIAVVISVFQMFDDRYHTLEQERLVQLIESYAIQCYATEGAYPPNLAYLQDNYGLILQEERFIYEYEPIAENILPLVQVIDKPRQVRP